jgi:hypothetical protein
LYARQTVLEKEICKKKILLAMKFDPGTRGSGGASRGSRSRNYEGVGKTPFVYP